MAGTSSGDSPTTAVKRLRSRELVNVSVERKEGGLLAFEVWRHGKIVKSHEPDIAGVTLAMLEIYLRQELCL